MASLADLQAERERLRAAPTGVLAITAGIDTQDNRLAVQIVGWGAGHARIHHRIDWNATAPLILAAHHQKRRPKP